MKSVIQAGTDPQEYTRVVTDAVIGIGDLAETRTRALAKVPGNDREQFDKAFDSIQRALFAYVHARDYFTDPEKRIAYGAWAIDELKHSLPNLPEIRNGFRIDCRQPGQVSDCPQGSAGDGKTETLYLPRDVRNALWQAAMAEQDKANLLISRLEEGS
jgi:hypothetical protein